MLQMVGKKTSLTSPIAGWNARDAVDLMGPADAIRLDNFFPGDTEVTLRKGFTSHATGLEATVESLLSYDGAGTAKMFAAAGSVIFDVTSNVNVHSARLLENGDTRLLESGDRRLLESDEQVTGLTNARWGGVNLGTSGGNFLWIYNETGNDAPRHYNGSTWATPSLSGITASDVVYAMLHKRRLFLILKDSLKFGFLAVNSIAGSVSTFDLSSLFDLGGSLQACGAWTRDGGSGPDDLAAFITTNGQVAIYAGIDPATAADWTLVGIFKIGRPIGRRCLIKVGADLIVITDAGVVPLSQVLATGESAPTTAITDKISGAFQTAARNHFSRFGWQPILYPKGRYGLFNIPISSAGDFRQYVVNLTTGAWCQFKGQNAHCWVVHQGDIYFGAASGVVYKADDGTSDNGAAILGDGKTAFNYFGSRGILKQFTMMQPVMSADGDLPVSIGFDVDFADGTDVYLPSSVTSGGAEWDVATWDVAEWASANIPVQAWRTIQGLGYAGAFRIRTSTTNQTVKWHSTNVLWIPAIGL